MHEFSYRKVITILLTRPCTVSGVILFVKLSSKVTPDRAASQEPVVEWTLWGTTTSCNVLLPHQLLLNFLTCLVLSFQVFLNCTVTRLRWAWGWQPRGQWPFDPRWKCAIIETLLIIMSSTFINLFLFVLHPQFVPLHQTVLVTSFGLVVLDLRLECAFLHLSWFLLFDWFFNPYILLCSFVNGLFVKLFIPRSLVVTLSSV